MLEKFFLNESNYEILGLMAAKIIVPKIAVLIEMVESGHINHHNLDFYTLKICLRLPKLGSGWFIDIWTPGSDIWWGMRGQGGKEGHMTPQC